MLPESDLIIALPEKPQQ